MSTSRVKFVRPISALAAVLLVVLSLGSGSAQADPGKGNGNGNGAGNGTTQVTPATAATTSQGAEKTDTTAASSKPAKKAAPATARSSTTPARASGKSATKARVHTTAGTAGTSGDPTQPQPNSNADNNTGGANGQCPSTGTKGPYCSTRDGSPSMNGNGGGKATGKPCAGCVGKADNKNPKGQQPGGSDHNNGYECDGNNGIGKSNPAHTGCQPAPPCVQGDEECPNPPCVQGDEECPNPPCVQGDEECPNPPCVQGDEECPNPPCVQGDEECPNPPCVQGDEECPTTNRPPTVLGAEAVRKPNAEVKGAAAAVPATLPATGAGASLEPLAAAGLGLLLVGSLTLALRRRQVPGLTRRLCRESAPIRTDGCRKGGLFGSCALTPGVPTVPRVSAEPRSGRRAADRPHLGVTPGGSDGTSR